MQQDQQSSERDVSVPGPERVRIENLGEPTGGFRNPGETLAEVAHDARNMVTALGLYCDLLEEPGVLAIPYIHYGSELRMVADASRRLVEKLVAMGSRSPAGSLLRDGVRSGTPSFASPGNAGGSSSHRFGQVLHTDFLPSLPIEDLSRELLANRNLLAALAGPSIALSVETEGGSLPVMLTGEDLTRVLVNLVKNAAEAMPAGGRIQLNLRKRTPEPGSPDSLFLTIDDSGPGIPSQTLEEVFDAGFTTQSSSFSSTGWPAAHRGLGLSITRSIIEAAGGRIVASNRASTGARFQIDLPIRER